MVVKKLKKARIKSREGDGKRLWKIIRGNTKMKRKCWRGREQGKERKGEGKGEGERGRGYASFPIFLALDFII